MSVENRPIGQEERGEEGGGERRKGAKRENFSSDGFNKKKLVNFLFGKFSFLQDFSYYHANNIF